LRRNIMILLLFILAMSFCGANEKDPVSSAPPQNGPEDVDAQVQNSRIGRGINLGNALEAPSEGEWGVTLREDYFDLIAGAGFSSVRIPVRWSAHAAESGPYTIDEAFFRRVDWAVESALSHGLVAVVNMHHYDELYETPAAHLERFLELWREIAGRYRSRSADLVFEVLNEPHGNLNAAAWNSMLAQALIIIRESNPVRNVIIGPASWNSINDLPQLKLPADDRHIIVTVHYYNPFQFTHQGADWVSDSEPWLGTRWRATPEQREEVNRDLDRAAQWGRENDRPLYVGEFGAYNRAELVSRALWTEYIARSAERREMSWAYWEFCASFGVYDRSNGSWVEPLLKALIP